jgi:hypothetical protein
VKYRLSDDLKRKLAQFVRSNYAELFVELFDSREEQLNTMLRASSPENFQQVQGRALELDELRDMLKMIAVSGE